MMVLFYQSVPQHAQHQDHGPGTDDRRAASIMLFTPPVLINFSINIHFQSCIPDYSKSDSLTKL